MNDQQAADMVEAILGGVIVECPFCRRPDRVVGTDDLNYPGELAVDWRQAYCNRCSKAFYRNKPRHEPAYRVGAYWTTDWRAVYERKAGPGAR